MGYTLVTAPAVPLLSLGEAKAHLNVDTDDDDAVIGALVAAATSELDGPTGTLSRALVTQAWKFTFDDFPDRAIRVPLPPLQSIVAVKYIDDNGVQQTLAPSAYRVVIDTMPGLIEPAYGTCWPSTRDIAAAVEITFTAGYGDAADKVPELIRSYAKLRLGDLNANREAVLAGASLTVIEHPWMKSMLENFRNRTASP